jgi:type IV secretion system protein TrbL
MRGVAQATIVRPAAGIVSAAASPVRDAFAHGAAYSYRATGPNSGQGGTGPGGPAPSDPPAWAQRLSRRQRLRDAAFVASQAVREGDRPMAPASPDLKGDGGKE